MNTNTFAVDNSHSSVETAKREPELSRHAPLECELAEMFGGGPEYCPFVQLRLRPFTFCRSLEHKEQ